MRFTRLAVLAAVALAAACGDRAPERAVVVYTSVDQVFAEPILKDFERETGIEVLAVYDVEAAKTTGLVNRLAAERDNPRADVFWNGEFSQTIALAERGVLEPYHSPSAADLPERYVDAEGRWSCSGGRARVLLVNTSLVAPDRYPRSLEDLLDPRWPASQIGIARPLFGSSITHAAALYATRGRAPALAYFRALVERGVRVVDGNAVVRDLVVSGDLAIGLTDTDDACGAIARGAPVAVVFPDQEIGGTLVLPATVALVARGPHPAEGRALVDYLAGAAVERRLVDAGFAQMALRQSNVKPSCLPVESVRALDVNLVDVFRQLEPAQRDLAELFVR